MERRGCNLGCFVAGLGLALCCCLSPYLISSIYSIITAMLQEPKVPWLWGTWLRNLAGESDALYMILAEGPICCVGTIGLLIVMLGLVMLIGGMGRREEQPAEQQYEEYGEYEEYEES